MINSVDAKTYISSINPYYTIWDSMVEGIVSVIRKTGLYSPTNETHPSLQERILALPLKNYESNIALVGKGARILDWSVFGVTCGPQAFVGVDELFKFQILDQKYLSYIPHALHLLAKPLSGFFFTMGLIEGTYEVASLRGNVQLLHALEKAPDSSLEKLKVIHKRYFKLNRRELQHIRETIEKQASPLSLGSKRDWFEHIAEKTLGLKLESLGRRITPGLAKTTAKEMRSLVSDLQSSNPWVRANAQKRADLLMKTVTKQVKTKIVIHLLALLSISCTMISMTALFLGVTSGLFFVLMGTAAIALMTLQFLGKKYAQERDINAFYRKFNQLKAA